MTLDQSKPPRTTPTAGEETPQQQTPEPEPRHAREAAQDPEEAEGPASEDEAVVSPQPGVPPSEVMSSIASAAGRVPSATLPDGTCDDDWSLEPDNNRCRQYYETELDFTLNASPFQFSTHCRALHEHLI